VVDGRASLVRRIIKLVGAVLVFGVLSAGAYLGSLQLTGNFHAIIPVVIYRSAQPTADDISRYHTIYGIRTIINLRGANPGAPWYRQEATASTRLGITHIDFKMSARDELSQSRASRLIGTLAHAQKPILIHCQAGADRTGLAAALYLAAVDKAGEEAAEAQISIRYGHISIPLSAAYAMDQSFEDLEPWLGIAGSWPARHRFEHWSRSRGPVPPLGNQEPITTQHL
jgi:protein tyrosine/serine phosphatase